MPPADIQKYNDPPVHSFLSICGINAGVAAFPQCSPWIPVLGKACLAFNEVLGDLAYNALVQSVLFQANYFRDPEKLNSTGYREHSQLAAWNGEGEEASAIGALMAVEWPERLGIDLPEAWLLELSHRGEGRQAQLTPPRNRST